MLPDPDRSYRDVARQHYSRIIVSGEVNQPDSFARSWSHSQPFLRAEQEAEAPSNQGGKRARACANQEARLKGSSGNDRVLKKTKLIMRLTPGHEKRGSF